MKGFKPLNKPVSTADRRLRQAIVLSLALHAPLLMQKQEIAEVVDQSGNIAYVTREEAKSVLNAHPHEKAQYVKQLKEALEKGERVDLGDFYLKSQYLDGRLEADRMQEALDKLASIETEIRTDAGKLGTLDVLKNITDREGEYSEPNSYLSTVLLEGKGNCSARERFTSSLVDRLYPDMEIAYQKVKVNDVPHTRTLVKVEGQWRNMESPKSAPLAESDLEGTVLFSKYDYVRHFVGQSGLGTYAKPMKSIDSHTKLSVTDDYLVPPLPDGVNFDNIKDIGSGSLKTSGQTRGFIGSPARVVDGAVNQVEPFSGDFVSDPIELEIITPEDVERNRKKTLATLRHWERLAAADASGIKNTLNTILPNMTDKCANRLSEMLTVGSKMFLESCKLHESSGLLSCEYGLPYGILPPGAVTPVNDDGLMLSYDEDFNCLPANMDRCSDYKKDDLFTVDKYLRLVFAFDLAERFEVTRYGYFASKGEEVHRVALEYGILEASTYKQLAEAYWQGFHFVNLTNNGFLYFRNSTKGTERGIELGHTFDYFYCQSEQFEDVDKE